MSEKNEKTTAVKLLIAIMVLGIVGVLWYTYPWGAGEVDTEARQGVSEEVATDEVAASDGMTVEEAEVVETEATE